MTLSRRKFVGMGAMLGLGLTDNMIAGSTAMSATLKAGGTEVTTGDMALYSSVPFGQVPPHGFFALNNTFGRGNLINGKDYTCKISATRDSFPNGTLFEWSWPKSGGTGLGSFAYGYPLVNYGDSYYGNPYHAIGPWPMKLHALKKLAVTYDLSLGGNLNSYDVLLDIFVTASPTSTDGAYVAEISFFPQSNDLPLLGTPHAFSFGTAYVGTQNSPPQICIFPSSGRAHRNMLSATIDLKEIIDHLISIGLLSGNEYLRGIQFGVEMQVPAVFNTAPYQGSMKINTLSYKWV